MARQELRFGHARAHSRSERSCAVWRTAGTYQLFFLNDSKQLIAGSTGYNSGFIVTLKLQCPPANIFHLTSPMPFSLLPPQPNETSAALSFYQCYKIFFTIHIFCYEPPSCREWNTYKQWNQDSSHQFDPPPPIIKTRYKILKKKSGGRK